MNDNAQYKGHCRGCGGDFTAEVPIHKCPECGYEGTMEPFITEPWWAFAQQVRAACDLEPDKLKAIAGRRVADELERVGVKDPFTWRPRRTNES